MTTQDAGIKLLPNGHVELHLDGGDTIVWRRPKLGEYKTLREIITAGRDVVQGEDGQLKTDEGTEDAATEHMAGFMRKAHEMVGISGELPEDTEEWDIWLIMGQTQTAVFQHWQQVPLVRG